MKRKLCLFLAVVVLCSSGLTLPASAAVEHPEYYEDFMSMYGPLVEEYPIIEDGIYRYRLVMYFSEYQVYVILSNSATITSNMRIQMYAARKAGDALTMFGGTYWSVNNSHGPFTYFRNNNYFTFTTTNGSSSSAHQFECIVSNYSNASAKFNTTEMTQFVVLPDFRYWIIEPPDGSGDEVDISALLAAIEQAKGIGNDGYTSESWSALQTAISDGESLLAGEGYTQAQVDTALAALLAAMDALEHPGVLPDTAELVELLEYARTIERGEYTAISWAQLQSAISRADRLLSNSTYTAGEVASAALALQTAINGLSTASGGGDSGDHRYMIDGFTIEDLLPAEMAIMENFNQAKRFGIFLFVAITLSMLFPYFIRRLLGFVGDVPAYSARHRPEADKSGFRHHDRYSKDGELLGRDSIQYGRDGKVTARASFDANGRVRGYDRYSYGSGVHGLDDGDNFDNGAYEHWEGK